LQFVQIGNSSSSLVQQSAKFIPKQLLQNKQNTWLHFSYSTKILLRFIWYSTRIASLFLVLILLCFLVTNLTTRHDKRAIYHIISYRINSYQLIRIMVLVCLSLLSMSVRFVTVNGVGHHHTPLHRRPRVVKRSWKRH